MRFESRMWAKAGRRGPSQDSSCATDFVLAVADGVGGAGPVAGPSARRAIERIASMTPPASEARLEQAIREANEAVAAIHGATTLCVAIADSTSILLGNVGDSRVQLVTAAGLVAPTEDHNEATRRLSKGVELSNAERKILSTVVYNVLGSPAAQIDIGRVEVEQGARILVSTDGLHDHYPEELVFEAIRKERKLDAARWALELLIGEGPADDVTFIVADAYR